MSGAIKDLHFREAHLMFRAKPRNGASKRGGIGGRVATRFGVAHLSSFRSQTKSGYATRSGVARRLSFRSGSREDARFGPPLLGCPHSAPEPNVLRGLA